MPILMKFWIEPHLELGGSAEIQFESLHPFLLCSKKKASHVILRVRVLRTAQLQTIYIEQNMGTASGAFQKAV